MQKKQGVLWLAQKHDKYHHPGYSIARKRQVSLVDTKYYHCISRCVRRAFLCGEDHFTGQSYEHRRGWVEDKLLELAKIFCIDVCAYAVMSNHTHLVLYVDDKKQID